MGRDVLSRLLYGGRVTFVGIGEAMGAFLLIGITVGLVAGFSGGLIDGAAMWLADLSFATPQIVVVMAMLAIFSQNVAAAMIVFGVLGGFGLARIVRSVTIAVREEQYILAAKVAGLPSYLVLARQVLPRIAGPVIAQASVFASFALLFETGLQFLGLATTPPAPTWGSMVAEGSQFIVRDPWMIVPPGCVIALTVIALGLLGDGVRDSYAETWSPPVADRKPSGKLSSALRSGGRRARGGLTITPRPATPLVRPNLAALLAVRDLSVGLALPSGTTPVVDKVSFEVHVGEAVGIVGESGCGKTLTALALLHLLPARAAVTGGEVYFERRETGALGDAEFQALRGSKIAFISQEPVASLDPSFTCGSQIAEVLRRHKQASRRTAHQEALELLGTVRLPDPARVYSRYPHELSGGMAQRVAIALALAGGPTLLIADEPTTSLDVSVEAEILELLHALLSDMRLSMVLISHNWSVVADLCKDVNVMYAGQIVERGDVSAVFTHPRHPYTVSLLAADPRRNVGSPRLPALPGSVVPIGRWPRGCRFAPRCQYANEACRQGPIVEMDLGDGHGIRCVRPEVTAGPPDNVTARVASRRDR